MDYPNVIPNWIDDTAMFSNELLEKINPVTERVLTKISVATDQVVSQAVLSAWQTLPAWSKTSVLERAKIIRRTTQLLEKDQAGSAEIIQLETGKSYKDAWGEVSGVIELGYFLAGEGQRFYGQTTNSAMANRWAYTLRQPVGICALITSFNTPLANAAWKAFPALLCGNTIIMKPSPDTPFTACYLARLLAEAGLPKGVFSIIQGGATVGQKLITEPLVDLISFTGSTRTGREIAEVGGKRLARVCLELGGKNPLVVCADANLSEAAHWATLSAFSNAGQRCASASRIIVFASVYEQFRTEFCRLTANLRVGSSPLDDLGPVINAQQLHNILSAIDQVKADGVNCLIGGKRLPRTGYYLAPTILEGVNPQHPISQTEIFGPVTCLYRVADLAEAITLANATPYGLTGAIHTASIHRAQEFVAGYRAGVVSINGPTYGAEPHLPFGGLKNSGNGWREPGTQVLDTYSEWKTVYLKHDPAMV